MRSRHREPGTGTEEGTKTGNGHWGRHRTQHREREQAPAQGGGGGQRHRYRHRDGGTGSPGSTGGSAGPRGGPRTEPSALGTGSLSRSRPVPPGPSRCRRAGSGAAARGGGRTGPGGIAGTGSAPGCGQGGSARLHRGDAGPGLSRAGGPGLAPVRCRFHGGSPKTPIPGGGAAPGLIGLLAFPRSHRTARDRGPRAIALCPRSAPGAAPAPPPPGRVPGSVPPCGAAACRDMPRHAGHARRAQPRPACAPKRSHAGNKEGQSRRECPGRGGEGGSRRDWAP